jgi:glycogen phosphorylase
LLNRKIAYFSMEIGLEPRMRTYAGGLGMLAGDTLRSAADGGLPLVAVTLLHRKGYFTQEVDAQGVQSERDSEWPVQELLAEVPERVSVSIEGRPVRIRAWKYEISGIHGAMVPLYLLDTDLVENSAWDRSLTDHLYGGDTRYRLAQEIVLGIGGLRMLRAIGFEEIERFHMNEGHSSLLTFDLLQEQMRASGRRRPSDADIEAVRGRCVFTTHTPVAAGHDRFSPDLVRQMLGPHIILETSHLCCFEGMVNLTYIGLNLSRYVNGVARKHSEVSRLLFSGYQIDSITNGVHPPTWTCEPMQEIFDRHIPAWRRDSTNLRYASSIPTSEILEAHRVAKRRLLEEVQRVTGIAFDAEVFTIGFARRATAYKRADLLVHDLDRLVQVARRHGRLQIVYAGKAHPQDDGGKQLLRRIVQVGRELQDPVRLVYLQDYGMELGQVMTSGSDLWLNTPEPPHEASGTSGMKAALNGVPSLSVLDGWWFEGHIEGITGWAIGDGTNGDGGRDRDADSLYRKLETIVPLYYGDREGYATVMRHAISLNASFFNTQRMIEEYATRAYGLHGNGSLS